MTRDIHDDGKMTDPLLLKLADDVAPIAKTVEADSEGNHAVLVVGVKYSDATETEKESVQTFVAAAGFFGIIAEGLYAELFDQITNGQMGLFSVLRDVVRDLEEDLGIDPNEDFGEENEPVLH